MPKFLQRKRRLTMMQRVAIAGHPIRIEKYVLIRSAEGGVMPSLDAPRMVELLRTSR